MSGGLRLETLTTLDELERLEPEWDALVRAMPRPSPFLLNAWLAAWWRVHGDEGELAVHVARRDGRLVGALPLYLRRSRGIRIAAFLGGMGHSHLADVLLAAGEDASVAAALAERVARSRIDLADLYGLPGGSRFAAVVAPGRLHVRIRVEAPVLDLPQGWEHAYAEKTSSKTRNSHRRKWKRLEELGRLEVRHLKEPGELSAGIVEGQRLHALRWRGQRDESGLTTERGRAFMREGYRALAERDVARVVVLELDGRAIAFNAYLELDGALHSHRLAYDPELARHSPGLLCTLRMLELASADGVRRVEWLGGTEDYKLQLMDRFEPLHEGLGLARTPQGHAVVAARLGSIRLRRFLKRSPTLRRLYLRRPAIASS